MLSQKERRTSNKYCIQNANQEAGVIIKIQVKLFHSNELDKNRLLHVLKFLLLIF